VHRDFRESHITARIDCLKGRGFSSAVINAKIKSREAAEECTRFVSGHRFSDATRITDLQA